MGIAELLLLAVGLSMDAFAVAVCKGLSVKNIKFKHMLIAGAWFGIFQAAMPLLGFALGGRFIDFIDTIDHWVAFALLLIIGANMLRESFSKKSADEEIDGSFAFLIMLGLALATSIDALAVGVTFVFFPPIVNGSFGEIKNVVAGSMIIGCTTFLISAAGLKSGSVFGAKHRKAAEIIGGLILIGIGIKILLQGLGVI